MANVEIKGGEPGEPKSAKERLLEFVQSLEFGTPGYLAVSGFFRENELYNRVISRRNDLESANSLGRTVERQSELRMAELQYALLEMQNENRKDEMKGFKKAWNKMIDLEGDVGSEIVTDLQRENPDLKGHTKKAEDDLEIAFDRIRGPLYDRVRKILEQKAS